MNAYIYTGNEEGQLTVTATSETGDSVSGTIAVKSGCGGDYESFGGGDYELGSINAQFGLGSALAGKSAGYLMIKESEPTLYWSMPKGLKYVGIPDDVQLLRDGYDVIRQIKPPEGLVDIVVVDQFEYSINYYTNQFSQIDANGYYITSNAAPTLVYRIENPTRNSGTYFITNLYVVKEQEGLAVTNIFTRYQNGSWSLSQGNGLKVETLSVSSTTDTRIELRTLSDQFGAVVSSVQRVYITNTVFGDLLQTEVVDPGGLNLCTSNTYDLSRGLVTRRTLPDGNWKEWSYDTVGRVTEIVSPWGMYTQVETRSYSDVGVRTDKPRSICKTVNSELIQRSEYSYTTNSLADLIETVHSYQTPSEYLITTNIYVARNKEGFSAGKESLNN